RSLPSPPLPPFPYTTLFRSAIFQPPLPASWQSPDNPLTPDKIDLGRMLYYDKRLSKNHDVSCNSCHNLDTYGVDNLKVSLGHRKDRKSTRLNSSHQIISYAV